MYMPAARSGKAYKLSRPFHGPYRIVKMHKNGAEVRPIDKPNDERLESLSIDCDFAPMKCPMSFGAYVHCLGRRESG